MGVLRTIAIIIIIYYVLKFITRYIVPIFLTKMMRNVEKKMYDQQSSSSNDTATGKVGETVIAKKPSNQKQTNNSVGDYIDYEEVKD